MFLHDPVQIIKMGECMGTMSRHSEIETYFAEERRAEWGYSADEEDGGPMLILVRRMQAQHENV